VPRTRDRYLLEEETGERLTEADQSSQVGLWNVIGGFAMSIVGSRANLPQSGKGRFADHSSLGFLIVNWDTICE
jgi:hypothetical protein